MTTTQPIMRRYWFADKHAVEAVACAENAPDWGESPLPTAIFCMDKETLDSLAPLVLESAALELIDATDSQRFYEVLKAVISREQAGYVQLSRHAMEDFSPALELIADQLSDNDRPIVAYQIMETSRFATEMPEADSQISCSASWIRTAELRALLEEHSPRDAITAIDIVETAVDAANIETMPLVSGAKYLFGDEQAALDENAREAAKWRARTAAAWSEIGRLRSEKRVRAGRETALAARHQREMLQQAEHSAAEIERLHRSAGWAGRWRTRIMRLMGRK